MNQKQWGIVFSYLNLIAGIFVNVFITPLMIVSLGDVHFSLYKVMQSFAGPLSMFNLGISTIVARSIVTCNEINDCNAKREKQNTMAMALISTLVMVVIVCIAGIIMLYLIPNMYGGSYSSEDIDIGQKIFIAFIGSTIFHMLTDAFSGCLLGREKFVFSSFIQLFRTALRLLLWFVLLKMGIGVIGIACVDLLISFVVLVMSGIYAVFILKETPHLYYFDIKRIKEILLFGFSILLQAIINQVNNNADTMILGSCVEDKVIITMYSSALTIYSLYNSLISVISHFFLPKATRLVNCNASGEELTDFVIAPGRFQAVLAVACIFGFALFGKNFISIWIGDKYIDSYWVTLILMIPVTIPLVENAMISVLDASLKRIYRSVTLAIMALINVVVSIFLIRVIGFWGAALGTVISLIVGHGFLMNIYYSKTFQLNISRMFSSIFKGILPAGIVTAVLCIPLAIFLPNTILGFIVKCVSFVLVYFLFLLLFGFNASEKNKIKRIIKWKHNES